MAAEAVIKTDGLGRMRTPAARRETLLDEFERSGLSGPKFAALVGIKYQTLAGWAQRRQRQRSPGTKAKLTAASADPVKWLEAAVGPLPSAMPPEYRALVVQLPGGARLEIANERQALLAAALVRSLASSC